MDKIECTRQNIQSEKYPLSRYLYVYTNGKPSGNVKKFVDFILSREGQNLVEEEGFVDVLK